MESSSSLYKYMLSNPYINLYLSFIDVLSGRQYDLPTNT